MGEDRSPKDTLSFMRSAIDAVRDAGDDKIEFVKERLEAEAAERDKRSQALFDIAQQRADDMSRAMDSKDKIIKALGVILVVLVLSLVALAGNAVGLTIPGFGEVAIGQSDSD